MNRIWRIGWLGLYGSRGLLNEAEELAQTMPSPAREVYLASIYYSAANKHRTARWMPWAILLVFPAIWHSKKAEELQDLADYHAAAACHHLEGHPEHVLSSGAYDVIGTVLSVRNAPKAKKYLRQAADIARREERPPHEAALPLARLALLEMRRPLREAGTEHEIIQLAQAALLYCELPEAERHPEQISRAWALLAEYFLAVNDRKKALFCAHRGLQNALRGNATTQKWRLRWYLIRAQIGNAKRAA